MCVEISGMTKRYGEVVAVSDLDLHVRTGEVFGFLGPNGAGKSTTIDVLLDLVRPTSGRATVFGLDCRADAAAIRERVGVLPEGASVYPRLTGREHLRWMIRATGADDDPAQLLERVGLDPDAADRRAGTYSKGMEQRLGLAMALVGDPDLLVLDEPSSGLDPGGVRMLRGVVAAARDRGATVFFSSHVLAEVEEVCDRVGILQQGRLVGLGTIDELGAAVEAAPTIGLEVDRVPDSLDLERLGGVTAVSVDGERIEVRCASPTVKVDVIEAVSAECTILDVLSAEPSLEALFESYTDRTKAAVGGDA